MQHAGSALPPEEFTHDPTLRILAALGDVSRNVSSTLDLPTTLERVLDALATFVPYDSATVMLPRTSLAQDGTLVIAAARGFPSDHRMEAVELLLSPESAHYPVITEQRSVVLKDARTHPGWQRVPSHELIRSWIGVPLVVEKAVIGMLTVDKWQADAYTASHATVAETFANYVAVAIHNARLYAESQRAYAELHRAQHELLQNETLHALGQLASGIAHDFNNILTSIIGNIQLLEEEDLPEYIKATLYTIDCAAQDGSVIVRRLQDFARPAPDKQLVPANLQTIIQDALELTRPRWQSFSQGPQRQITVVADNEAVYTAPIEIAELRQVLVNMLLNAVDAMPDGGVLRVATGIHGGEVFLSVQDSGKGIAPELQERIFEPFFTTKGRSGSGMGLTLSKAFAARHGGHITLQSAQAQGSTFTLWLPLGSAEHEGIAMTSVSPSAQPSVLVVDDDPDMRSMLQLTLEAKGYNVTTVESAHNALHVLGERSFDIIVTDLIMPNLNGWEFIRMVRKKNQSIGIVLISGWSEHFVAAITEDQLIDAVLAKPFSPQDLLIAVETALHESAARACKNPLNEV